MSEKESIELTEEVTAATPGAAKSKVIEALIKENIITEDQVAYAQRVEAKLKGKYRLIDILKQLKYVRDEDVWHVVQKKRLSTRLGHLLVEMGYITQNQLDSVVEIQKQHRSHRTLSDAIALGSDTVDKERIEALALELGFRFETPDVSNIDPELMKLASMDLYESNKFIPMLKEDGQLIVAFSDPTDQEAVDTAKELFGETLLPVCAYTPDIIETLNLWRAQEQNQAIANGRSSMGKGGVGSIIADALKNQCVSGIMLEPDGGRGLDVYFKIDNRLTRHQTLPIAMHVPIIDYLERAAEIVPREDGFRCGTLKHVEGDASTLIPVKLIPSVSGWHVYFEMPSPQKPMEDIWEIPLRISQKQLFRQALLDQPGSLFIVSSPPGFSLDAVLSATGQFFQQEHLRILRIASANTKLAGCDIHFYPDQGDSTDVVISKIQAFYPDVVICDSIATAKDADIIIRLSQAGFRVVGGVSSGDVYGVIDCLKSFGLGDSNPGLLSGILSGILFLSWPRKICEHCQSKMSPAPELLRHIGYGPGEASHFDGRFGKGCAACNDTGFSGTITIADFIYVEEQVRRVLSMGQGAYGLRNLFLEAGQQLSMFENGILKAVEGLTTLQEIIRSVPKGRTPRPVTELSRITEA